MRAFIFADRIFRQIPNENSTKIAVVLQLIGCPSLKRLNWPSSGAELREWAWSLIDVWLVAGCEIVLE